MNIKRDAARPVGEGKYAIIEHQNHAELAFILERPREIGEAQKELGIQKEASYIITVINPYKPVSEEYPTAEAERPKYPEDIQKYLNKTDGKFIPLSQNLTHKLSKCSNNTYWCSRRKRCDQTGNRFRN
jgi:hypothetical protein